MSLHTNGAWLNKENQLELICKAQICGGPCMMTQHSRTKQRTAATIGNTHGNIVNINCYKLHSSKRKNSTDLILDLM